MMAPEWAILAVDALLTFTATLNSLALRRVARAKCGAAPQHESLPPLTVVVTACNQDSQLEHNLPFLLSQDYPAPYEVIVVDMASQDTTRQVLERLEASFPFLRHTFTPSTARDISLERLALTLGIRSAAHPWTVLLHAACQPVGPRWLYQMAQTIVSRPGLEIVLGPVCATAERGHAPYEHLWHQLLWLPFAARHGIYCTGQCNVAYRQDLFLRHRGFAQHALLAMGAIDIMANHHSTPANAAACIHPDAVAHTPAPGEHTHWRLLAAETRRHLTHHRRFRLRHLRVALAQPIALLAFVATAAYLLWVQLFAFAAGALALLMLHCGVYHWAMSSSLRLLHLPAVSPLAHFQALAIPVRGLSTWIRHRQADRRIFRKKFV